MTSSCNGSVHTYRIRHSQSTWTVNPPRYRKWFVAFPAIHPWASAFHTLHSRRRRSHLFIGTQLPLIIRRWQSGLLIMPSWRVHGLKTQNSLLHWCYWQVDGKQLADAESNKVRVCGVLHQVGSTWSIGQRFILKRKRSKYLLSSETIGLSSMCQCLCPNTPTNSSGHVSNSYID